jgi:hypothetical protein
MLWRDGCDGKALRYGAGERHQQAFMHDVFMCHTHITCDVFMCVCMCVCACVSGVDPFSTLLCSSLP